MVKRIGIFGLGTMGQNLTYNFVDRGFEVAIFDLLDTKKMVDQTLSELHTGFPGSIIPCYNINEFVNNVSPPRVILLMIKAGDPVDNSLQLLLPHLDKGDIIIDGGNSNYHDTVDRVNQTYATGVHFLGMGVSGGAEGARYGPSLMVGGSEKAWNIIKHMLQTIAATNDEGVSACYYMGKEGAGHMVKMIHNGIEYGEMQLISECYDLLRRCNLSNHEIAEIFSDWNEGELGSYLLEITTDILRTEDNLGDGHLIDYILDTAAQKGTGRWTAQEALEYGIPFTIGTTAVFQRCLSSQKDRRVKTSNFLEFQSSISSFDPAESFLMELQRAVYIARIINHSQGFELIYEISQIENWDVKLVSVARVWTAGCIIRSNLLNEIIRFYSDHQNSEFLLESSLFRDKIRSYHSDLRNIISVGISHGVPIPALSSALSYLDSISAKNLPANLLQAQRDYFGSHGFERTDRDGTFHGSW